ncbi:dihydrolipoamide acetyltransferase family protein [Brevibacterium luteolum]|uniref:dihydrolipoamide acetyltransferase family protein n=1 Tax=Brevibacterium luteolum TaxID=199591 RepID=UPI00223ABBB9|nr:dihydrolipoamide acetyltransferase family protein [Brevibacterium luteolum]MCT1874693.1 2-oxo acid dehydrogenase subunit E2 [Brevibacterium luteolum]MCT1891822.1 2-oxo acid dehydrogenase subunit E2 [Brevibacterium luteolum]MCT1894383.1 2-oxo acid dehydrogenase subunit E2 [Brevibacterium luteolum]MCT1925037.1 2-oxo acid dehydrogenase subunit E2 [Brevibacterium luteolum]
MTATHTSTGQDFILPDLGEGLTEAEVVSWKVEVGDTVAIDEIVAEVESAKSVVDLPCPYAGVVTALHFAEGDTVHAGQAILTIGGEHGSAGGGAADDGAADAAEPAGGEDVVPGTALRSTDGDDTPPGPGEESEGSGAVLIGYGTKEVSRATRSGRRSFGRKTGQQAAQPQPAAQAQAPAAPEAAPAPAAPDASTEATGASGAGKLSRVVSPLVRKMAADNGFVAKELTGSGPGGMVMRRDVMDEIARRSETGTQAGDAAAPAVTASGADTVIPLTGLRKVVAERLSRSRQEVPEATIWLDVDATELLAAKKQLEAKHGEKFSVMSLVARFVTAGLQKWPILNSSVDEAAGEIRVHADVNLGLAADTPRGLMVPVVHGAGGMTLRQLRDAIGDKVDKASTGRFDPSELSGGTFTLNNYGVFGVDGSAPIINLPEVAMLGLGRIKERPWVVDGELTVRKVMYLSFVFDHRVCDGREPSEFITFIADCIENPISFLADI